MLVNKISITDCAKQLELSRVTIYAYIKKGLINLRKTPGGKPFFLQEDIDELCKREELEYFETSAYKNTGIKEGFSKIATMAYKTFGNVQSKGQKLNNKKKKKKSKC